MKRLLIIAGSMLLLSMASLWAQLSDSGLRRITGRVVDRESHSPLPGAVVSAAASGDSDTCGNDGRFEISVPVTVACTIYVARTGYEREETPLDLRPAENDLEITLKRSSVYDLQEMTVVAGRYKKGLNVSDKVSEIALTPEIAAKLPAVGQTDLFRTMQLLPGVTGSNELSSGLYIRGGTPDQNLVLIDNIPVYYVDHFYGFFSAFNPRAIGGITMYKGGFGPQWGGRLSGVVSLTSNGQSMTSDSGGIKVYSGAGLLSNDFMIRIPFDNNRIGMVMLAGRRAMTDLFKPDLFGKIFGRMHGTDTAFTQSTAGYMTSRGIIGPDSVTYIPQFYFRDLNGLATFHLGTRGRLSTTVFTSHDDQTNAIDTAWFGMPIINYGWCADSACSQWVSGKDSVTTAITLNNSEKVIWGNTCIGQEWEQHWSDLFSTRVSVSYSQFLDQKKQDNVRTDRRTHRFSDTTAPFDSLFGAESHMTSTNRITDISSRFDNTIELSGHNTLAMGVELSRKNIIYERDTTEPDTTTRDWQNWYYGYGRPGNPHIASHDLSGSWAVYAEDEMRFGDAASVAPGLRLYRFQNNSAFAVDPRCNGWWQPVSNVKIKAGWGLYTQEIHRVEEENIVGGSRFIWLLTNKDRPLGRSQQLIGGISWEKKHVMIDAEGYYKRLKGLLTISERMRSFWDQKANPFDPDEFALFEGSGTAKGIDILAQLKNISFPLFTKDAVYDGWGAYTLSRTENSYQIFNNGDPFPASNDHTHEIKLVNSLEVMLARWSSLNFGAVWIYATGAPYTAPIGEYSLAVISDSIWTRTYLKVSDKNAYRLPDYHRLDVSMTWKVGLGEHVRASLTMGVFNVYNHVNVLERTYTESAIVGMNMPENWMNWMDNQTTIYTAVDRMAMAVMPNTSLDVSVLF